MLEAAGMSLSEDSSTVAYIKECKHNDTKEGFATTKTKNQRKYHKGKHEKVLFRSASSEI